ncbi:MAG: S9 family peptidase [Pseudomonadaceae bacterium]|nr:S9 family peptidase [Pseudomonadaceae bacterium]
MSAQRLTPERLFSDPPLTGGLPGDLKFSPCGRFVCYLRAAADDRERMDLWRVNLDTGEHEEWINARLLQGERLKVADLTDAERAERERRRQFNHGITEYSWHPKHQVLLAPIDGQAVLIDASGSAIKTAVMTPADQRQSAFQISPDGGWLSFVHDGNLFTQPLNPDDPLAQTSDQPLQITSDANATLSNGLPDFLAAEEMHRFRGHWFCPNGRYLVYCKVDESPVAISYRLEMQADGAQTIQQRYPYAGAANPSVSLWVFDLQNSSNRCIWQNSTEVDNEDVYLARVQVKADSVYIQTQDRRQQHLTLKCLALQTSEAAWQRLHQESSTSWINLNDDLTFLDKHRIVISSENTGTNQLYLLNGQGDCTALLCPTHINAIRHANDEHIFVSGWHESPLENHLFKISLSGDPWLQLTTQEGWHDVVMSPDASRFIDRYSHESQPPSIHLRDLKDSVSKELWAQEFNAEHPYHPFKALHATAQFGSVTATDGQQVYYRLTPPAEIEGQHATIVYVYGGPGPQKSKREWSPLTVQLFAQNGFAVLEIDNRGSGNRGIKFESPIYRNMGHAEVEDQVAGLQALNKYTWADLSRVGIFGHSYGGYMTLMSLSLAPQHFAAGVAVAPVCDWRLYDTHYTERYMGLPAENEAGYTNANVLSHLAALDAPLLLMHGMADDNVLFTNSTQIMARLQQLGKAFELMTYPGAKHSMQERDVSIHRFNMILAFFKRHLRA